MRTVVILLVTLTVMFAQACSASEDGQANNWIEKLFPSMSNCTPRNGFYFNADTKRTNSGLLEGKGYSPYKVDAHTARYKIHEKFFGLDAIEIAIPSSTDSVYAVVVSGDVKQLSRAIFDNTGKKLRVVGKGFKAKSGVAYLAVEHANEAMFVCFTFEE